MFVRVFGLSMDCEVLLVSQSQEQVHAGEDSKRFVVSGLVSTARVVAAAFIMVFVFVSFLLNGHPSVNRFGVGLAVAVILDATVVRWLLVSALMIVLGRKDWYMLGWLDRLVRQVNIGGSGIFDRPRQPALAPARALEAGLVG
jgi:RND superfamily putative drug exporter